MKKRIDEMVGSMTLTEKIGQVVICGFQGTTPSEEIETLIGEYGLGNVIIFRRNVESPRQLKKLTSDLQKMSKFPLSIAIDQEGGIVTRLTEPFTTFPGNMATSATGDPHNAYLTGLILAKEMRAVGINWDLAPDVDVNDLPENPGIGVRSYSDDPEIVSEYASEFVRGLNDAKVAACGKHFPGKGHSAKDAHLEMPTVERPLEELEAIELAPFRKLISEGIDSLMPSHVYYPALCERENLPATLSKAVMTELLKDRMGFGGVVVTDDLEMGGITNSVSGSEAAWRSFLAGADVVMICHTFDEQVRTLETLANKVETGEIPLERLDDAVKRVLSMKEKIGIFDGDLTVESAIGSEDSKKLSEEIVRNSITLVRNEDDLIRRAAETPILVVIPSAMALVNVEESGKRSSEMERAFRELGHAGIETFYFSPKPTDEEIAGITEKITGFEGTAVLCTLNANTVSEMGRLVGSVMKSNSGKTILAAMRNPYDCYIDGVRNSVALYNYSDLSQRIFAGMIEKREEFSGRLPLVKWGG